MANMNIQLNTKTKALFDPIQVRLVEKGVERASPLEETTQTQKVEVTLKFDPIHDELAGKSVLVLLLEGWRGQKTEKMMKVMLQMVTELGQDLK